MIGTPKITWLPSPTFSKRNRDVNAIIISHTKTQRIDSIKKMMLDKNRRTSTHFVISRCKETGIFQFVNTDFRAHHTGRAALWNDPDVNSISIGIQLLLGDSPGYTPFQYSAASWLASTMMFRHPKIVFNRIVGHDSISTTGQGPGEDWFWDRFFDELIQMSYGIEMERS